MNQKSNPSFHDQLMSVREMLLLIDPSTWKQAGLWMVISALTTGIPASIQSAFGELTKQTVTLGFDSLFAQTAPLILSVAVVAFACHRGWLNDGGLIPSAAFILLGGWLGHFFQHRGAVTPVDWLPTDQYALLGRVVFAAVNLLVAYFLSYGAGAMVASIVVGSVLGVGWSRRILG